MSKQKKDSLGSKQDATAKEEVREWPLFPTPWRLEGEFDEDVTVEIRASDDSLVCEIAPHSGDWSPDEITFARLATASPELLAATKRAYQAFSNILEFRIIHDPDKREAIRDIVAQLSRALVKAEGTASDERTTHPNPADQPNSNTKENDDPPHIQFQWGRR